MTEAETGVILLQAEEWQGWLATTRNEKRVMGQMLLLSPQEGANVVKPGFWMSGLLNCEGINFLRFKYPVCVLCYHSCREHSSWLAELLDVSPASFLTTLPWFPGLLTVYHTCWTHLVLSLCICCPLCLEHSFQIVPRHALILYSVLCLNVTSSKRPALDILSPLSLSP